MILLDVEASAGYNTVRYRMIGTNVYHRNFQWQQVATFCHLAPMCKSLCCLLYLLKALLVVCACLGCAVEEADGDLIGWTYFARTQTG